MKTEAQIEERLEQLEAERQSAYRRWQEDKTNEAAYATYRRLGGKVVALGWVLQS